MGDDLEENFEIEVPEDQKEQELDYQQSLKKRKESQFEEKEKKSKKQKVVIEKEEKSIANLDSDHQAKYFNEKFDAAFPDEFSAFENDKVLEASHFASVNFKDKVQGEDVIEFLRKLDKEFISNIQKGKLNRKEGSSLGSPLGIIVCMSTERAQEIFGSLKKLGKKVKVEKGWSKQIKLDSQLQALKSDVHFIVGTPNRICKLFEVGGLFSSELRYFVIDSSFKTAKNFNIFDQFDTRLDLFQLYKTHLQDVVLSHQAKIVLM